MATKAQKVRVGAFVIGAAILMSVVLIIFGGLRFWEKHVTYRVVFAGSVMGLEKGATVYLNGMKVGRVDDIKAAPEDLRKVEVSIALKDNTPIHVDTRAMLQFAGITGLKVIDLRDGTHASARLAAGGTILEGESTLDKLEKQAKEIADQSTQIMQRANKIVENLVTITDPKHFDGMDEIIAQSRVTANNLAATSGTLQAMVTENRVTLKRSLDAVHDAADSTSRIINTQVAGLVTTAGDFMGQLRAIVSSNEAPLKSAVTDLRQASRNLKEMTREVRQRPSRLLFSGAADERKLP